MPLPVTPLLCRSPLALSVYQGPDQSFKSLSASFSTERTKPTFVNSKTSKEYLFFDAVFSSVNLFSSVHRLTEKLFPGDFFNVLNHQSTSDPELKISYYDFDDTLYGPAFYKNAEVFRIYPQIVLKDEIKRGDPLCYIEDYDPTVNDVRYLPNAVSFSSEWYEPILPALESLFFDRFYSGIQTFLISARPSVPEGLKEMGLFDGLFTLRDKKYKKPFKELVEGLVGKVASEKVELTSGANKALVGASLIYGLVLEKVRQKEPLQTLVLNIHEDTNRNYLSMIVLLAYFVERLKKSIPFEVEINVYDYIRPRSGEEVQQFKVLSYQKGSLIASQGELLLTYDPKRQEMIRMDNGEPLKMRNPADPEWDQFFGLIPDCPRPIPDVPKDWENRS